MATNLEEVFQPLVIDEIMKFAAGTSPMKEWPNYAIVSKAWRDSARRVFPVIREIVVVPIKFDGEHTMATINTKDEKFPSDAARLVKRTTSDYAWTFSVGVGLRSRNLHQARVTHAVRVQGGGLIGVFICRGPPPPAAELSFQWTEFPFASGANSAHRLEDPFFLAFIGTFSGSFYVYPNGPMRETPTSRLDSPQGTVFDVKFDVERDEFTVEIAARRFKRTVKVFGDKRPDAETMSGMQLRWVASLYCPGTTFTFQSIV